MDHHARPWVDHLPRPSTLRTFRDLAAGPRSAVPPAEVADALFNPRLAELVRRGDARIDDLFGEPGVSMLLSTTPDELSRAPQFAWKYVAVRGRVHAVASREEGLELIERTRGARARARRVRAGAAREEGG